MHEMHRYGPIVAFICSDYILHTYNIMDHQRLIFLAVSCFSEMGLEEEAPPLPPRNYSWSDMEDNDDELFQSDDDLDDTSAPITISDHQKIYSSVGIVIRLSPHSLDIVNHEYFVSSFS